MSKEEQKELDPRESLRNFVIESKVRAFTAKFKPFVDDGSLDCVPDRIFNEQSLRKFFGAYPKTVGDPLVIYLDEYLAYEDFNMEVDELGDEPVLKVSYR